MIKLKKILLVDDSKASNLINYELLLEMGVAEEIVLKNDGMSALSYIKGEETEGVPPLPDLILLDIEMPKMNGFEFLQAFEKLDPKYTNNFQIVISMLSNHLQIDNFQRAKEFKLSGVFDHIRKPVNREDIENLLYENFDE
jgi:CheY-like chemotaxis protein